MYFFWIPASIAEAAAVIPNGAKIFFAKGTATFINGPANLLNNDPKNPPEWIILKSFRKFYVSWHKNAKNIFAFYLINK